VNLTGSSPAVYSREDSLFNTTWSGYPVSTNLSEYGVLWNSPLSQLGTFQGTPYEENQCVTEALARLNEGKVNVATMLGESIRSANMIADAAGDLFSLLLAVKRGGRGLKYPRDISKSLASGWLAWNYGWKPLANDLYTIANEWNTPTPQAMVLSSSRTIRGKRGNTSNTAGWFNRSQSVDVRVQCKLFATLDSSFAASARRIGMANPLQLGWEFVPYSFVVDWALPVGTFLEALNAHVGLTFLSGYTSRRYVSKVTGSRDLPSGAKGVPLTLSYETLEFSRTKLGNFPRPVPYARNPFSTNRVVSALALFRQLLK
jgi:hypothetical protein